ncbi:hypothetical protein LCGC14_0560290 [marine sediment metagenome]|uniref:Uncharacterized protein n=1 Tax=marine sediment metagenome TaxID=412755 RepID=A0A0F9U8S5_9ZZZZ
MVKSNIELLKKADFFIDEYAKLREKRLVMGMDMLELDKQIDKVIRIKFLLKLPNERIILG